MVQVAKGRETRVCIGQCESYYDTLYPKNALELYFTSNHDENSWNKADYGTMPGAIHAPFAVFTLTMYHSIPLIYSGQEEPVLDSLSFFYKDAINFKNYRRAKFLSNIAGIKEKQSCVGFRCTHSKNICGQ